RSAGSSSPSGCRPGDATVKTERFPVSELLKILEVAKELSVSAAFVYARLADGSLQHYRLGNGQGGIRISREQLQAYLDSRARGGEKKPAPEQPRMQKLKNLSLD